MWPSVLDLADNNRLWFRSWTSKRTRKYIRVDNRSPPIRISINFDELPLPPRFTASRNIFPLSTPRG